MENILTKAFDKFSNLKILVIGDVMIDAYMWGKVDRISPEAPVPVISVTKHESRLGGAANVGLNINELGATPILCACIGNDTYGNEFTNLLKNNNMPVQGIMTSNKRQTTVKTRIISNNQHLLRVDDETDKPLDNDTEQAFINHIDNLFETYNFNAIIFEDYDKGNITPSIIEHVVKKANSKNIPTLVDPKKRNFLNYNNVTVFKPNFKEICEGLKIELQKGDINELNNSALKLCKMLNAKHVMVTLSELGVFVTNNNTYCHTPAQQRGITDVSGAGDTVISVTACALAAGLDINTSVKLANIAGGLVCEQVGVVPVNKNQLLFEAKKLI